MEIISNLSAMQSRCGNERAEGRTIAFVPTMGYLHEGHLSLLREGRRRGDLLVLSIFVNPTQFGVGEDLDTYPRDLGRDVDLARSNGTDLIFVPEAGEMYPPGYATYVEVEGLGDGLCGANRPGHFRGVTTVVSKLFALVQPHVALFGRKDFQQLAIIRQMTRDLNLPVEIVGLPIVREPDGLAMSSRNVNLSPTERQQALALSAALRQATALARGGESSAAVLIEAARERIAREAGARIDYIEIRHQQTLAKMTSINAEAQMLLAVRIGSTRLIDNCNLFEGV